MPETFSQDDSAESPAARFINPHRTPTFPPATRSTPVGKIDKGIGVYNFASPDTHARQQHHFLSSGMIFCCSKECVHAAAAHHLRTLCTLVTTIAQLAVARDSRISSRQLATARNSSQQLATARSTLGGSSIPKHYEDPVAPCRRESVCFVRGSLCFPRIVDRRCSKISSLDKGSSSISRLHVCKLTTPVKTALVCEHG